MVVLSIRDLAERWGYAADTIYKGIKNNPDKWPLFRQADKKTRIMFDLRDVERFEKKIRKNPKKS